MEMLVTIILVLLICASVCLLVLIYLQVPNGQKEYVLLSACAGVMITFLIFMLMAFHLDEENKENRIEMIFDGVEYQCMIHKA